MINESLATIEELGRIPAPCPAPQSLACDGTDLWIGSVDIPKLYGIRSNTGAVFEESAAPGYLIGIVVIGDEIRAVSSENEDDDNRVIRRYVMGHGFKSEAIPCPNDTGSFLAWDGDHLYLSQRHDKQILQLDADGRVTRTIAVPRGIVGMTVVNGCFYLMTAADRGEPLDHRVMRLDARLPEPAFTEIAAVTFDARSLSWDGTKFWTSDRHGNELVAFAGFER
jgi:hypothetical protein